MIDLLMVVALLVAGVLSYRKLWYLDTRHEWNRMVHEFNMAMVFKMAETGRMEQSVLYDNFQNYYALGEFPHGFYNLLNWKMDALVKDRGRYEMVKKYLDERRAEMN